MSDRTILDINSAFEELFLYNRLEVIGRTSKEICFWVDLEDWRTFYEVAFIRYKPFYMEVKVLRKDRRVLTCLISGNYINIRGEDYIFVFYQNISDRVLAEQAVRLSEAKYRGIFNSVNEAIVIYDMQTRAVVDVNRRAVEMFGYPAELLKRIDAETLLLGIIPYHFGKNYKLLLDRFHSLFTKPTEWQVRSKQGHLFWAEISAKETQLTGKKHLVFSITDISERKKSEQLLLENEFLFRTQFNSSNIGIVIANAKQVIIKVNRHFCRSIGYSAGSVAGLSWVDFTVPEDIVAEQRLFEKLLRGEMDFFEMEKRYKRKDGSIFYAKLSVSCLRTPDGSVRYFIGHVFDITDRVEMEDRVLKAIVQAEENEKARFSRELHDGLGPILSAIKMQVQWLAGKNTQPHYVDTFRYIDHLVCQADSAMREIVFGLSPEILRSLGLVEALRMFIGKIACEQSPSIVINSNFATRVDEPIETVLYRVLTECINNSLRHSQASSIEISLNRNGARLEVRFCDNGIGFNWEETHSSGKGLGLSNMLARVKSINGIATVNTQPGMGFELIIYIDNVKDYSG